jgi:1-acyl-sn-glycerol-3-phosphate acyltransferase
LTLCHNRAGSSACAGARRERKEQSSAAMQNVVVAKPYRFFPPGRGTYWPALLLRCVPFYLRKYHGIAQVACRGVERLRASIAAGHGIVLAPNHCRPCDPMVVAALARETGHYFYTMASWHLFMQNRLQAWLLQRAGVFSVHREGSDRTALDHATRLIAEAERMLLIFPEGVISRNNDRLNYLMSGAAIMARGAARLRAAASPPGRVVIHPVAIRYFFDGDLERSVTPVLEAIEARMAWLPQRELPLVERVLKIGSAMLALKEIEHFGEAQRGSVGERVERLVDRLLSPLEDEWAQGRHAGGVVRRVKVLRKAILPGIAAGGLPEAEQDRRERQLADMTLAQQLAFYPAGYFDPVPTPERILETVERFEEDTTGHARVHAPMRALVDVGEAIEVPAGEQPDADSDPVMVSVRERMRAMLAASLAEARPDATMK